ncbi:GumC family protein [Candidatus Nitrospira neomarina]|uniref:GumC family protein n=1 Tax=Candidatus Nitrospira neomarina TaxID=3020899 RepID=A0AA96GMU5_9BACT|nr:GumC family protein [Candidatus Nitrospira neomarina]WNM64073.1 GumC family protein [Candidatus Nitrospira neomarina]
MSNLPSQPTRLNQESGFFSLRDILTILFKHQWEIIAIFVFCTMLSYIVPMKMTPIYRAESSLMVKIGREHMYNAEVGDHSPKMAFDLQAVVEPEIKILTSRDLIKKVVETIGVKSLYPEIFEMDKLTISPLEVALTYFPGNLSVDRPGKSNVIVVGFEHQNPQVAAQVVNLLGDFLKEKHLAIFSNPQTSFLEEQVQTLRKNLEQSETALQEFKREHGISSILDQRNLLFDQRQTIDSRSKANEDQVQGLSSKINSLKRQLHDIPQYIPISTETESEHPTINATRNELLALRRKEQQLLGKYQESSRMVTDVREEIALIQTLINKQEAQAKEQIKTVRNPVYQDIQLELLSSESELTSLKTKQGVFLGQIVEIDSHISRLNQLEKQFDGLQREVNKDKENLKIYVEKLEMANISTEMDKKQLANVSVIQSASPPISPIKPKKSLILYFGIAFGLLSGVAWAFVSEFFKGGYTRPEQLSLEQGIPVLASINYKK